MKLICFFFFIVFSEGVNFVGKVFFKFIFSIKDCGYFFIFVMLLYEEEFLIFKK